MAPTASSVISLLVFSAVHVCVSSIGSPEDYSLRLSCAVHLPKCSYYNANFEEGVNSIVWNEVRYNMLPTIDPKVFDHVQELDISGNAPLRSFDFFRHLPMLETLNISRMNLSFTPAMANIFDNLSQLSVLDLSANRITELPDGVFAKLVNLKSLDLSRNNISMLPMGSFAGLLSLDNLNLRHNRISKLDFGTFSIHGMKSFGVLDLSYNSFIDPNLNTLATLRSLNTLLLHGNDIWTIDPQVLQLFQLQQLGIQHTDVKCRNLIELEVAGIELIADHGDYVYGQRNMFGIRCEL